MSDSPILHLNVGNDRMFEASGGAATITTTAFLIFLLWYLFNEWRRYRLTAFDVFHMPLGMQVAVAVFIADFGNLLVRAPLWYVRIYNIAPNATVGWIVLVGSIIFAIGMLCKIRVFSREHLGHAPWIVTGCILGFFVGYRIAT